MPSKPSLPVEILDRIFYFLRDDIPALQSSADVNQNFADIVERHLYHHISLGDSGMTAAQLSRLLVVSPHIPTYVKSLRITLAARGLYHYLVTRSTTVGEEFASFLPRLPYLTTVCLYAKIGRRTQWPSLHPKFQSAFVACIQSPTVVNVSISLVDHFPLSLLEDSPQLQRLFLKGNFSTSRSSSKLNVVPCPRLQGLMIAISHELVEWLHNIDITHIVSLTIWMYKQGDMEWLPGVLTKCSESLTYLELNSSSPGPFNSDFDLDSHLFPPVVPTLDLSMVPRLQHLHIGAHVLSLHNCWVDSDGQEFLISDIYSTPNPWIIKSLQTLFILPNISLQFITLHLTFHVLKSDFHKISWGILVDTLQRFDSLRRVELQVTQDNGLDFQWLAEALKGDVHLARLIDRGLLLITKSTRKSSEAAILPRL